MNMPLATGARRGDSERPARRRAIDGEQALRAQRTPATRSSRRPVRRRSATGWPTHPPARRRGSWRSSGRGPTATATRRTRSTATRCSTTIMLYWATTSAASSARFTGRASAGSAAAGHGADRGGVVPQGDPPRRAGVGGAALHRRALDRHAQRRPFRRPRTTRAAGRRHPRRGPRLALRAFSDRSAIGQGQSRTGFHAVVWALSATV